MERIKLSKLSRIIGGKPNPMEEIAFATDGIPFVKMKDLGEYHHTNSLKITSTYLNENYARENGYKILKKGTILLPRSGSVGLNHRAVLGVDAAIVSHICAIEVSDHKKLDKFYLYYYLTLLDMGQIAQKTTGLDSITFKRLGEIKIPMKPMIEQEKIVARLNKIQELINKRFDSIQLLDQYINSIFLEMFLEKFGKWAYKPLKYSNAIKNRIQGIGKKSNSNVDGIPMLRMNNISTSGEIQLDDLKWIELSQREKEIFMLKNRNVLFNRTNSPELVGKIGVWDKGDGYTFAGYLVRLELDEDILNPYYLSGFFNSDFGRMVLRNKARLSGNLANISGSKLMDQLILIPPIELQNEYEKIYLKFQKQKINYKKQAEYLSIFFQAYLQDAFSKESQIEEDEVFESLLQNFTKEDLKQGERLEHLIKWINKNKNRFSTFDQYDNAWDKLRELLEDGSIEQVLDKDEIKLKVVP